jgi:hypothetical protein
MACFKGIYSLNNVRHFMLTFYFYALRIQLDSIPDVIRTMLICSSIRLVAQLKSTGDQVVNTWLPISGQSNPFANNWRKQFKGPFEIEYAQHAMQGDKKQGSVRLFNGQLDKNVQYGWVHIQASDNPRDIKEKRHQVRKGIETKQTQSIRGRASFSFCSVDESAQNQKPSIDFDRYAGTHNPTKLGKVDRSQQIEQRHGVMC